jgi:hypothetical protein
MFQYLYNSQRPSTSPTLTTTRAISSATYNLIMTKSRAVWVPPPARIVFVLTKRQTMVTGHIPRDHRWISYPALAVAWAASL